MREKTDVECAPDFYKGAYAAIEVVLRVLSEYPELMDTTDLEMRLRSFQDDVMNALLDLERDAWTELLRGVDA